ncbi:MAG: ferrochelatase, partial [Pseudomonadota bacterium]|nr:ferrochelatase [Pseudomonadota bacterium]
LTGSQRLADELAAELQAPVVLSMRYGNPSIQAGIEELAAQGVEHVIVVPLYAQHADSTVTTSLRAVEAALPATMQHSVLPPFYGADEHSQAWGELIKQHLPEQWDHLLLSYHGLPEQHLRKADPTKNHCLQQEDCCYQQSPAHKTCYRHQVYTTSSNIAAHIGLSEDQYSVSFQSRLGPLPWLSPYTDKVLAELPDQGVKNLVVASPAFVVDNLETLEEIGMQGQETFLEAGGESFHLVPCLNADPLWVSGLARLCRGAA